MLLERVPKVLIVLSKEEDRLKCKAGLIYYGLKEGADFILLRYDVTEYYVIRNQSQQLVFDQILDSDMATKLWIESLLEENERLQLLAYRDRVFDQMILAPPEPPSKNRRTVFVQSVLKNMFNTNMSLVRSIVGFVSSSTTQKRVRRAA